MSDSPIETVDVIARRLGQFVPDNIFSQFIRSFSLLRNYRWRLVFPLDFNISPYDIESVTVPMRNVDKSSWVRDGKTSYYATEPSDMDEMTVTLYEHSDARVIKQIYAWKGLIQNSDGTFNYPYVYQRDLILQLVSPINIEMLSIKIKNAWPSTTRIGQFSYSASSEIVKVTQSFVVNDISLDSKDASIKSAISSLLSKFSNTFSRLG